MAAETQEPTNVENVQTWNASQYENALAHLEQLQEQLDDLRSTIPSVIAPMMQPAASKAQMFADIKKAALVSTNNIKAFRDDWKSQQSQTIFTRSKESLEKNADLAKAGDVPKFGWSER